MVRLPDCRLVKLAHRFRDTLAMAAASVLRSSCRMMRGLHPYGTHWSRRRWDLTVEQFAQDRFGDFFWV